MRIDAVELRQVRMPLKSPFRTSFGSEYDRSILLLAVHSGGAVGWGECVAMSDPLYSSEYRDAATDVLLRFLLPALADRELRATDVGPLLERFRGHRMAKAAIEAAVLDAELQLRGESLAGYLGATTDRVAAGVSVGIADSIPALLQEVGGYLDSGYRRIKLKIQPGWDVEPVAAVRREFGAELPLQVDANTAYRLSDARQLARLDEFDLLLIEQPLPEEDLLGHARLAEQISTPVCLDESITSAESVAQAITLGACEVVNIKPGRVGGYLEARRIHDVASAHGLPVWCGGMLETGIGRAANLALAALPGFVLPGDTSASDRYYAEDLTEPFVLEDGYVRVPTGPGIGVAPDPDRLSARTESVQTFTPGS
ncbi:o-succinylbenzoate synthase [Nakamurella lactea]|uniref:o-succinylbenzoate synthase n=1 Tax=Nakamurella lactea TaxID=459515 RepID=UPI0003F5D1BA|nr:o-succinylbenzoate synthase [Nakamurella lactea]